MHLSQISLSPLGKGSCPPLDGVTLEKWKCVVASAGLVLLFFLKGHCKAATQNPGYEAGLTACPCHLRHITSPFRAQTDTTTFDACCKSTASLLLKLWERDCMLEKSKGLKLTAVHPAPRCAIQKAMSDLEPPALCAPVPSLLPTLHITYTQHSSTWSLLTLV